MVAFVKESWIIEPEVKIIFGIYLFGIASVLGEIKQGKC